MLLLNDNDFYPDESELHRFGADPRDQSYRDHIPDLPRLIGPCNTEHKATQLLWLLNLLCKAFQDN